MSTLQRVEFGYYPMPLAVTSGPIIIASVADLAQDVATIEGCKDVDQGWIYAPPQHVLSFDGRERQLPYSARVFGLPKTHVIEHASSDGDDHLTFHLWTLSFFTGMRLTATEAGFVDATPIRPGEMVDFIVRGKDLVEALSITETFWGNHRLVPERAKLVAAIVHALFLAQNPRHLQFERFLLLYTAFDACFALAKALRPPSGTVSHASRVKWMCDYFSMSTPSWADPASGSQVATMRNASVHEALFMGEPLGFALHGVGTNQNLPLEMQALICRLVIALIGCDCRDYVRSPVDTRQKCALDFAQR